MDTRGFMKFERDNLIGLNSYLKIELQMNKIIISSKFAKLQIKFNKFNCVQYLFAFFSFPSKYNFSNTKENTNCIQRSQHKKRFSAREKRSLSYTLILRVVSFLIRKQRLH